MKNGGYTDHSGRRFGSWTVLSPSAETKEFWLCLCDCGTKRLVDIYGVTHGKTKSCGCKRVAMATKHGNAKKSGMTSTYNIWRSMKRRCMASSHNSYRNYGARGITVCERWLSFENFYADMGDAPPGKTLDRIDNNKGYSKENCRWATWIEQANNRRNLAWVEIDGVRHRTRDIEASLGLSLGSVWHRLKDGWSLADACSIPKGGIR